MDKVDRFLIVIWMLIVWFGLGIKFHHIDRDFERIDNRMGRVETISDLVPAALDDDHIWICEINDDKTKMSCFSKKQGE